MNDSDFAAALKARLNESRRAVNRHPTPENLAIYRSGGLDPEEERTTRDHLVSCEACSSLVLGLADLESGVPDAEVVSDHELERAWRAQRSRLFPDLPRSRAWVKPWAGWAAAACLGLIVAGLGFEVRELHRQREQFYKDLPRVIAAERSTRSQAGKSPTLVIGVGQPSLVLLLVDGDQSFDSFRAEFLTGDERSALMRHDLSVSEDLLLVAIPPDSLPAGPVRVVVSGLKEGRYEAVEEYDLRVEIP